MENNVIDINSRTSSPEHHRNKDGSKKERDAQIKLRLFEGRFHGRAGVAARHPVVDDSGCRLGVARQTGLRLFAHRGFGRWQRLVGRSHDPGSGVPRAKQGRHQERSAATWDKAG